MFLPIRDKVTRCQKIILRTCLLCSFLPESTVWLIAKKRFAEAKAVYEKAANLNRVQIPAHLITISQTTDRKNKDASLGSQIMEILKSCCLQFKTLGIVFLAWYPMSHQLV